MAGGPRSLHAVALVALVVTAVVAGVACRATTDVTVTVITDVPCATGFGGATITVGRLGDIETKSTTAWKSKCTSDGNVGTVVIVPSGTKSDLVAMKIVMGIGHSAESCTADNGYTGGCIVARRALHFVPHEDLHVSVPLHASCIDFPCGPNETCVDRACVPATISDPGKCDRPEGCGEDALGDGGAGDATMGDGGARDAGDGGDAGSPIASMLVAGDGYSCALTSTGGVRCWGEDSTGQLGENGTTSTSTPRDVLTTQLTPLTGVVAIGGGSNTTCALSDSGTAKCWGITLDKADPDAAPAENDVATDWPELAGATEISVGFRFICWRVGTASVKCMGRNDDGELENGGTAYGFPPVTSLVAAPIVGIASGQYFSCALRENGDVSCAGDNGLNNVDPFGAPSSAPSPHVISPLPAMTEVRAGEFFACGRVASDSSVQCWGDDGEGQAGYPSDGGRMNAPHTIQQSGGGALVGVKRIALGQYYGCAITSTSGVVCWGANDFGQLGRGDPMTVGAQSHVAGAVIGVSNVIALATGSDHACAMDTQRRVFCWGHNQFGQCGQPLTTATVSTATLVGTF